MIEDSNKKKKKQDFNKVEEPVAEYSTENTYANIEEHPLFIKVIEKSIKEAAEGKGIPQEEALRRIRENPIA